ncbi:hypothetical protein FDP41_012941 [Naegleria fowleri]|uniref:Uncharacterized protein n=1 Tax=Naegleria fowleri TaxID=5763 RepID=A0A6A5BSV0_NAEFO|nr:uncharacterized protein FDP41_012941 [Naegleria fowleri]KAF0981153.1 hypothetical protein FDP41_012941 [Naegleria fowleri]CAG4717138.1 unnamed protein product [Naegleria fowleri]
MFASKRRQLFNSLFQSVSLKSARSSLCNKYSYSACATRSLFNQTCNNTSERSFFTKRKKSNSNLPIETSDKFYSHLNDQRIVDDGSFKSLFRIWYKFLTNIRKHLSLMELCMIGIGILATSTVVYRYLYIV